MFPEAINLQDGIAFGDQDLICVSLSFSGERSGDISLILPTALCQELSANILGEDMTEDGAPEKGLDAAKETLNIIAGQLLIQVFGETAIFNLPRPRSGNWPPTASLPPSRTRCMSAAWLMIIPSSPR